MFAFIDSMFFSFRLVLYLCEMISVCSEDMISVCSDCLMMRSNDSSVERGTHFCIEYTDTTIQAPRHIHEVCNVQ